MKLARTIGFFKKDGKTRPITEKSKKSSHYHGQTHESPWKRSSMKEIKDKIKDEAKDSRTYKRLSKKAPTQQDKEILENISEDELRHEQELKKMDPPNKEYWIQDAIQHPGSYRASIYRRYGKAGFTETGTIRQDIIAEDSRKKGKLGKQARLARTLRKVNA